jgi:hypothetical protein
MEKRIAAAILLVLSLVAAAAGVADEMDSTIRLPSDDKGEKFIKLLSTSSG